MDLHTFVKKRQATAGIIALLVVLHFLLWACDDWKLKNLNLKPSKVWRKGEYSRLFTNAFFHGDLTHLGLNLLTTFAFGKGMEKRLGTKGLIAVTAWSVFLTSVLYVLVGYFVLSRLDKGWRKQSVKGFSGVLFHWTVLSCYYQKDGLKGLPFFKDVKIPARNYPWVSLLFLYLLEPDNYGGNLIHAMGIAVGTLHVEGFLRFAVGLPLIRKREASSTDEVIGDSGSVNNSDGSSNHVRDDVPAASDFFKTKPAASSAAHKLTQNERKKEKPLPEASANDIRQARLKRFQ